MRNFVDDQVKEAEKYRTLSDEELVLRYKKGQGPSKKEVWAILCDRYLGLVISSFSDIFEKKYSGYNVEPRELFDSTFKLAMEREIFKSWKRGGLNVKNWFEKHFTDWLPGDTDIIRDRKEMREHLDNVPLDDIDDYMNNSPLSNTKILQVNVVSNEELEKLLKEAIEFLNTVTDSSDSVFANARMKGRKQVIKVLRDNYQDEEEEGVKTDEEKSKEVGMTESSFSMRKIRALDDLIEELKKRDYSIGILTHFVEILNYRIDTLLARIKKLKEST